MLRSLLVSTVFLSSALISGVDASSEISFFRQNSCNAGTGFYSWSNPNPLTSDVKCHPVPAGAVALYISDIDEGCTSMFYLTYLTPIYPLATFFADMFYHSP